MWAPKGAAVLVLAGAVPTAASSQQRTSAPASLVFDEVTVVDVEYGKLVPNQRVVIVGNHIQSVGVTGAATMPKDAQVVKARGKYLIPGLWDMHHHPMIPETNLLLIANGVTGFRDAWTKIPLDTMIHWRREILTGARVGPPRQILAGGAIDAEESCDRQPNGWAGHMCVHLGDTADARLLAESLKAAGAEMLKIYTPSWEIYAAARRAGLRFGGHSSGPHSGSATAMDVSDSGSSILDHSFALGKPCSPSSGSVGECRKIAERLRRNGSWWAPTCIGFVVCGGSRAGAVGARFDELMEKFIDGLVVNPYATAGTERSVFHDVMPPPQPSASPADPSDTVLMRFQQEAGVPFLAGTDVLGDWPPLGRQVSGFALHAELAMDVAEGLAPLNVLQSATLNPAKFLQATDSLGTVASGKLADLVLLDADPLADITNTTTIRAVVANGRYFDRAALDGLLAEFRAKAKQEP